MAKGAPSKAMDSNLEERTLFAATVCIGHRVEVQVRHPPTWDSPAMPACV